ncbi:MAG: hypothetical protein O9309_13720 [Rhizobium sp.]|nr:hypothetical protein [Rhizobium sp.]MCZ8350115.1 hypothetical protein [Rhizobium sp.]
MQIQSAYGASSYSATTKPASTAASEERPDLEQMLENLRKDPAIDARITENEDGSYEYSIGADIRTAKTFAAHAIITELNGESFSLIGTEGWILPSDSDAQLFKQLTGYNLLILGDHPVVLDDDGFPPAAADEASVKQAFDFITHITLCRAEGYFEGDLTSENIGAILAAYNISPGTDSFIDRVLELLNKSETGPSVGAEHAQRDQINELLDIVSA